MATAASAMSQNLCELISAQSLVLYPDAFMRLCASRAVAIEGPHGWRISKLGPTLPLSS
jgi:hypothetical protein